MGRARTVARWLLSKGVLSAGWYSVLTGLALAYVAYLIGSASEDDAAAPLVAVALAVAAIWQLERGLRAEFRRSSDSPDEVG